VAVLALLAAIPCVVALLQLGRVHDDEVFQFLEPALARARGYGILAWEWRSGLRNWAIPGMLSLLLRVSDAMGIENPRLSRVVLEIPLYAVDLWALSGVYLMAARRVGQRLAWAPVVLVLTQGLWVSFSGRTLSESFSSALLLVALEALDREERSFRAGLWGGGALGLAVVSRYGSAVFVLAALVWLAAQRRWRMLLGTLAAGAVVGLALGVLDWATWGDLFHSFTAYIKFNVLGGNAAQEFGTEAWYFYLPLVFSLTPVWTWLGLAAWVMRCRPRVPLGLFSGAVYLVAISATAHKESRFLVPAAILWAAEGAIGLTAWLGPWFLESLSKGGLARTRAVGVGLVAVILGLWPYSVLPPIRGDQFRAVAAAARGADVTGLILVNEGVWGSPGYFFLGKRIRFQVCDWPSPMCQQLIRSPAFNRISTYDDAGVDEMVAAGYHVVERVGQATWLAR
jgi:hypothetical protein